MENVVNTRLQSIQLGEPQTYKTIAIVPLIAPANGIFQYRTGGEALATGDLAITEVSVTGSIPELMVINRGSTPVLLIDGEELVGAMQNRVPNTSILLKAVSETKISVSCTEHGRWSYYASKGFSESDNVMAYKTRSRKTHSVHRSLDASGAYHSHETQRQVWDGIAKLRAETGTHSPTSAMNDIFKAREEDLRTYDEIFQPVPNQVGLLALVGGSPAGADLVSLTAAYAKLHRKLVRSYTLESSIESRQQTLARDDIETEARTFLEGITAAEERQFPSIGHGTDHRFKGKTLSGTALVHENEVIHAVFFRLDESEQQYDVRGGDDRFQFRTRPC